MDFWILAVGFVFTVSTILIYKFVVNPQMLTTTDMPVCPDRWNYSSSMCVPSYETHCLPFNPQTIVTDSARCNIAHMCGTIWGLC
jgi:hypothetical protein